MKTITINTAAAWVGTLSSWQDGDVFRETNTDTVYTAIANRLGYLKTTVDGKASVSSGNTWAGSQIIAPTASAWPSPPFGLSVYRSIRFANNETATAEAAVAGIEWRTVRLNGGADETKSPSAEIFLVPTTTGNRIYRFNAPSGGMHFRFRVVRPRTADAHTVTIQNSAGSKTYAVISASSRGTVELTYDSTLGDYIVTAVDGTVTSISTDV